jgi:RNA polymerase sigma-70 factor (ECF subfamily)
LDFLKAPRNRQDNESLKFVNISTGTTPDNDLEIKEKIEQIEALIEQLPKKQRTVIQLRGNGDCSLEEIEVLTGESAANVRVLLSRARKTLKNMLLNR